MSGADGRAAWRTGIALRSLAPLPAVALLAGSHGIGSVLLILTLSAVGVAPVLLWLHWRSR